MMATPKGQPHGAAVVQSARRSTVWPRRLVAPGAATDSRPWGSSARGPTSTGARAASAARPKQAELARADPTPLALCYLHFGVQVGTVSLPQTGPNGD